MLRWLAVLALMLASAGVRADPAAPLPPAEKQSLEAFAAAHEACQTWSDGCVVCRRMKESSFGCSTPGIACQPSPLMCQDAKEAPKPAEAPVPAPMSPH